MYQLFTPVLLISLQLKLPYIARYANYMQTVTFHYRHPIIISNLDVFLNRYLTSLLPSKETSSLTIIYDFTSALPLPR